ncbi:COP23 domain-containing protein [Planktothricoides sp. SR001]|uniref:COP23 domain-containing protein n=1 Tax=Planktothricoides sp. SR001 TaxID=1705388 RepID=UPI0006C8D52C|nr:COP23 domain-containing protein [Planktothricoides sp. SR001]
MSTQPFTSKLFRLSGLALLTLGLVSCQEKKSEIPIVTARYFCGQDAQGTYTTYAETPKGKQAIIRWKSEYFSKSGWTPKARCEEVSPQFQQAADNNQLNYITNDTRNNLPIVCAAIDETERCGMMLFTLRPEDDPETVREMLTNLGKGGAMDPIPQSGGDKVYIPMSEVLKNTPAE